jgi:type IV pilus biogenesis protein PilP
MKKTLLRSAALALLPSIAFADPSSDVQQLTALHNQVAILTQQLAVARLQAQIAQQGSASSAATPAAPPVPGAPAPVPAASNLAPAVSLPTIISIVGSGIHLTATLQTQSGTELVVVPGQALPGGLTVYRITENGVSVLQGGNIIPLPFASDSPAPASSTPASTTAATTMLPRIIPPPPPNPPSMTSSTLPGGN